MSARSDETILVADSEKYGRTGFANVLPVENVKRIITDTGLDEEAAESLREFGIDVVAV
jgi:DeoR/GlpR family transcriptional regulator of sugar metabolism